MVPKKLHDDGESFAHHVFIRLAHFLLKRSQGKYLSRIIHWKVDNKRLVQLLTTSVYESLEDTMIRGPGNNLIIIYIFNVVNMYDC